MSELPKDPIVRQPKGDGHPVSPEALYGEGNVCKNCPHPKSMHVVSHEGDKEKEFCQGKKKLHESTLLPGKVVQGKEIEIPCDCTHFEPK